MNKKALVDIQKLPQNSVNRNKQLTKSIMFSQPIQMHPEVYGLQG